MNPRSPARKALTILTAVAVGAVALWSGAEVVVISGTKANFTFIEAKSPPGGSPAAGKTSTTTSTPATSTKSTRP